MRLRSFFKNKPACDKCCGNIKFLMTNKKRLLSLGWNMPLCSHAIVIILVQAISSEMRYENSHGGWSFSIVLLKCVWQ